MKTCQQDQLPVHALDFAACALVAGGESACADAVAWLAAIPRALPQSLSKLVNDDRLPRPIQHLRCIYPDPGRPDWEVIRDSGGIVGIRGRSTRSTIKKHGYAKDFEHLEGKDSYSDWTFAIKRP